MRDSFCIGKPNAGAGNLGIGLTLAAIWETILVAIAVILFW